MNQADCRRQLEVFDSRALILTDNVIPFAITVKERSHCSPFLVVRFVSFSLCTKVIGMPILSKHSPESLSAWSLFNGAPSKWLSRKLLKSRQPFIGCSWTEGFGSRWLVAIQRSVSDLCRQSDCDHDFELTFWSFSKQAQRFWASNCRGLVDRWPKNPLWCTRTGRNQSAKKA